MNKPINQNFFENENEYSIFYICKHIHSNIGTNAGKHSDSKIKALSVWAIIMEQITNICWDKDNKANSTAELLYTAIESLRVTAFLCLTKLCWASTLLIQMLLVSGPYWKQAVAGQSHPLSIAEQIIGCQLPSLTEPHNEEDRRCPGQTGDHLFRNFPPGEGNISLGPDRLNTSTASSRQPSPDSADPPDFTSVHTLWPPARHLLSEQTAVTNSQIFIIPVRFLLQYKLDTS